MKLRLSLELHNWRYVYLQLKFSLCNIDCLFIEINLNLPFLTRDFHINLNWLLLDLWIIFTY
jgi:hypothetical protein